MTFKQELEARIQRYKAKAEELRAQKEAIEQQLQACEALLSHWEKALQAEIEMERGVELPIIEEATIPSEEIVKISVPKAVEEILRELGRPASVKEIYQWMKSRYPNLQVKTPERLISAALTRKPSSDKFVRTGRGIYKLKKAE